MDFKKSTNFKTIQPPVPVKPWYGIRSAIQMGQSCPQGNRISSNPTIDIEDCLYLNVYTPKIPSSRNNIEIHYPVLVYIHGGTFSSGSNREFPPSYLLEHDIVLIVPNYRLNALGKHKLFRFHYIVFYSVCFFPLKLLFVLSLTHNKLTVQLKNM